MRDDLVNYYNRELSYLRELAVKFAEQHPKVAARLVLEPTKCEDPHVERLLEAFAFLAARVHLKIDDEFPEIAEALLNVVYPHLIRPVPSMSIVELQLDLEQGKLTTGLPIKRNSTLYSRPVAGEPCTFRTCYDTVLWPVSVVAGEWKTPDRLQPAIKASDSAGAIRIELQCGPDVKLPQLQMDRLRFHLRGDTAAIHTLYEILCSRLTRIVVRDPSPKARVKPVTLPASALSPVGFADEEGMLPYPRRSFIGYRLLQEYFTFPDKYLFLDVTGLQDVWASGFGDRAELVFLISDVEGEDRRRGLESDVSAKTFRLGCTPIINLFSQTAEPIQWNQEKYEYPVIADVRRPNSIEVFSVDEVACIDSATNEVLRFEPFYSLRHTGLRDKVPGFWLATRRAALEAGDGATELFLSLVDLSMRPIRPQTDTITVRTTCTNRDLPSRLPIGSEDGDFELEGASSIKRIVALTKPTSTLRPPIGRNSLWRLVSHLSLNYLSLVEEGKEALQKILELYDFTEKEYSRKMIEEGILDLKSRRHFAPLASENGITFARGTRVEMELDENQFAGGSAYLFSSVLEHFLGLYASLNSFCQLTVTTKQRKGVLCEWPPRAGQKILT